MQYLGHVIRPRESSVDNAKTVAFRKLNHRVFRRNCAPSKDSVIRVRRYSRYPQRAPENGITRQTGPAGGCTARCSTESSPRRYLISLSRVLLIHYTRTPVRTWLASRRFQTDEIEKRRSIRYLSRSFLRPERNYPTLERECLAVILAVTTLRPYL